MSSRLAILNKFKHPDIITSDGDLFFYLQGDKTDVLVEILPKEKEEDITPDLSPTQIVPEEGVKPVLFPQVENCQLGGLTSYNLGGRGLSEYIDGFKITYSTTPDNMDMNIFQLDKLKTQCFTGEEGRYWEIWVTDLKPSEIFTHLKPYRGHSFYVAVHIRGVVTSGLLYINLKDMMGLVIQGKQVMEIFSSCGPSRYADKSIERMMDGEALVKVFNEGEPVRGYLYSRPRTVMTLQGYFRWIQSRITRNEVEYGFMVAKLKRAILLGTKCHLLLNAEPGMLELIDADRIDDWLRFFERLVKADMLNGGPPVPQEFLNAVKVERGIILTDSVKNCSCVRLLNNSTFKA